MKSIFSEAEDSTPLEPVLHELLTRHKTAGDHYQQWSEGLVLRRLLSWLAEQYSLHLQAGQRTDEAVDFLDTPSSKGFVIHFEDTGYSLQEAEYFQLYLRAKVLSRNYRTQVGDTKTYSRKGGTERTDRYYLKPRPNWQHPEGGDAPMDQHTEGQFDQQFGNVLVELVVRNEKPYHLRFSATVYHDRIYKDARQFGGLMDLVLGA